MTLRAQLAERAASVRLRGDGDAGSDASLDALVRAGLTKRGSVDGTTVSDAVTVLDDVAEVSWRAWQESKVAGKRDRPSMSVSDTSTLSVGDMMELAGAFGCIALGQRLKTDGPDKALLTDDDGGMR